MQRGVALVGAVQGLVLGFSLVPHSQPALAAAWGVAVGVLAFAGAEVVLLGRGGPGSCSVRPVALAYGGCAFLATAALVTTIESVAFSTAWWADDLGLSVALEHGSYAGTLALISAFMGVVIAHRVVFCVRRWRE